MEEILKEIVPKSEERANFKEVINIFLGTLNRKLKNAEAILGGSGAKDTWLSGNHDIDVFVKFDYKKFLTKTLELSDILQPILKKSFPKIKISRVHGSRDYFQLSFKGYSLEVIPILDINKAKKAANITDISPLHSKWVKKKGRNLENEIRLAKKFFRANNLYGAESHIGGFSGYVLEILVIYYGSFEKLLKNATKWRTNYTIDIENHYAGKNILFELNSSKHSPLVVIDPVDRSRNAAAALTLEKFSLLKRKANIFLKKPHQKHFEKDEITFEKIKKKVKNNHLFYIEIEPLKGKGDVVGSKLLKAFKFIKKELEKFEVINSGWEMDKFYFILKKEILPETEERKGPPVNIVDSVDKFKKKNKEVYVKNGRLYTKIKIKHRKLESFVNNLLKQDYFKERVKKVKKFVVS